MARSELRGDSHLTKAVSAGTTALSVGVVNGETLLLNCVLKIDRGALDVGRAHLVDDHLDTVEIHYEIVFHQSFVKEQLVDQTRATARLNRYPQTKVIAALLLQQVAYFQRSAVGDGYAVGSCTVSAMVDFLSKT